MNLISLARTFTNTSVLNTAYKIPSSAWVYYTTDKPQTKGISLFYNLLQQKNTFIKTAPLLKWEDDLKRTYTEAQWTAACNATFKTTNCSSLWELSIKLMLRWYLTPDRISWFQTTTSNLCWRQCGQKGDLLHTFWGCPKLTNLWSSSFRLISQIAKHHILPSPSLALLSLKLIYFRITPDT